MKKPKRSSSSLRRHSLDIDRLRHTRGGRGEEAYFVKVDSETTTESWGPETPMLLQPITNNEN